MEIDPQVVEWTFKAVVTAIVGYATKVLSGLKSSVDALNVKIAVVVEQVRAHEKRITKLEDKKD